MSEPPSDTGSAVTITWSEHRQRWECELPDGVTVSARLREVVVDFIGYWLKVNLYRGGTEE